MSRLLCNICPPGPSVLLWSLIRGCRTNNKQPHVLSFHNLRIAKQSPTESEFHFQWPSHTLRCVLTFPSMTRPVTTSAHERNPITQPHVTYFWESKRTDGPNVGNELLCDSSQLGNLIYLNSASREPKEKKIQWGDDSCCCFKKY